MAKENGASTESFRLMLESMGEGILALDGRGMVSFMNGQARQLLLLDAEENVLGVAVEQLLESSPAGITVEPGQETTVRGGRAYVGRSFRDTYEGGLESCVLIRCSMGPDGNPRALEALVHPLLENGQVSGAVASLKNVTERFGLEQEHRRLIAVVEQTRDNVIITDTEGVIVYVNPSFEKTTGYSADEVVGQNPRFLKGGSLSEDYYKEMWKAIAQGETWLGHFSNRRKDGSSYEVEATNFALLNSGGKVLNFISIQRDVTRMLELEAQLRQAKQVESVGTLAGTIAHDFNNLLTPLISYAEITKLKLEKAGVNPASADAVLRTLERAKVLVSRIRGGPRQEAPTKSPIQPQPLFREVSYLLRASLPPNVEVVEDIENVSGMIMADSLQIHQVLMNLGVNAGHAMENGGRLLLGLDEVTEENRTMLDGRKASGRFVRFIVEDNGVGIEPDILPRIFNPFFTTRESDKGTGLGLHSVRVIVDEHQGFMALNTQPGKGTRFEVLIPVHSGEEG
ncbi:MAG: PAS domain S-box protein, partial [Deltaproteobacteria bacterium]|nr:PAS domain S-box protein [Deltaproteobacteria bacterium]